MKRPFSRALSAADRRATLAPHAPLAVHHDLVPELDALVGLFHPGVASLGTFEETTAQSLPPGPRRLLAHEHHMTVTLEQFHGAAVRVRVVAKREDAANYAREILLSVGPDARHAQAKIVQYGIMRVRLEFLAKPVREKIVAARTPLGRILIEHDVHRRINLFSLWKIEPSPYLANLVELDPPRTIYGRTALIYCDNVPAVELLEVVTE